MSDDADDDGAPEKECPAGIPAWVMTFADLMSLLMCFFVLLLSFSEINAKKFKQMAGSMKMAFGVQRQIEAPDIPKGTSIIAQEFSPGKPEPTPLKVVQQMTFEEHQTLDKTGAQEQISAEVEKLRDALEKEIHEGLVDVETREDKVIIRIREKGSFPSGSAELNPGFIPVLMTIVDRIKQTQGKIVVAGHTDDIPIHTFRFRSNWELASARAVSVLQQMVAEGLDQSRLELKGLADTQPLVPNTNAANRAQNRRVEIIILTGKHDQGTQTIDVSPGGLQQGG